MFRSEMLCQNIGKPSGKDDAHSKKITEALSSGLIIQLYANAFFEIDPNMMPHMIAKPCLRTTVSDHRARVIFRRVRTSALNCSSPHLATSALYASRERVSATLGKPERLAACNELYAKSSASKIAERHLRLMSPELRQIACSRSRSSVR